MTHSPAGRGAFFSACPPMRFAVNRDASDSCRVEGAALHRASIAERMKARFENPADAGAVGRGRSGWFLLTYG